MSGERFRIFDLRPLKPAMQGAGLPARQPAAACARALRAHHCCAQPMLLDRRCLRACTAAPCFMPTPAPRMRGPCARERITRMPRHDAAGLADRRHASRTGRRIPNKQLLYLIIRFACPAPSWRSRASKSTDTLSFLAASSNGAPRAHRTVRACFVLILLPAPASCACVPGRRPSAFASAPASCVCPAAATAILFRDAAASRASVHAQDSTARSSHPPSCVALQARWPPRSSRRLHRHRGRDVPGLHRPATCPSRSTSPRPPRAVAVRREPCPAVACASFSAVRYSSVSSREHAHATAVDCMTRILALTSLQSRASLHTCASLHTPHNYTHLQVCNTRVF